MLFQYRKVLLIGATSGIGYALAERMLSTGTKVIIVGRRKERLDELVSKYNKDKAFPSVFDISKLSDIPSWASSITKEHPDLDCIILNSGIQRAHNFAKPDSVNLEQINEEMTTNYLSYVHLTTAFLPHLQKQQGQTSLIYVSSGLALVPFPRALNYSATKAALHHFILSLRVQLKSGAGNVKVVEIFPPAVQTELPNTKHQPDLPDDQGANFGMPLDKFTNETWEGLQNGDEQIFVGDIPKKASEGFEGERQKMFMKIFGGVSGLRIGQK
jgi:short-subunit dehydrogenase involved in D-alanine esterification of teichoic acids